MYNIKDTVLYGSHGVCRIEGTEVKNFSGEKHEYYVLKPVYQENSTYYVPVDNENLLSKIRKILSQEEITELIHSVNDEAPQWNENENDRKLGYSEIISAGDRYRLMMLIKSIYIHRRDLESSGKKLHQCDEKAFREAEKLLYDEFALVLKINPDQVLPFILQEINIDKQVS